MPGDRNPFTARGLVRLEEQVLALPPAVGVVRMLGLVGLIAASVQLLTWPLLGGLSSLSVHAALTAATALGSVGLLVIPARALTRATSSGALVGALILQTGTAATTGDIASPFLAGYVGLVLTAALFATLRMTLLTVVLAVLGLLVLALRDLELSGPEAVAVGTLATMCVLVGLSTSLLASRQRHELRRVQRRLRRSRRSTSRRRIEALTDPLTGLGNRRAFDADVAAALVDRRAPGLLLVMADVDGLKTANDTFGHPVGDAVLRAIGAALRARVRAEDRVYRVGGDEFAALSTSRDPAALERRLGRSIETPVPHAGLQRAAVGLARAQAGDDPLTLVARADAALYRVKGERACHDAVPPGADGLTAERTGPVG